MVLEADGKAVGEVAGVFAAAEGARGVGVGEGEDGGEDLVVHDGDELVGAAAGGVEGGDHAAHRGAGEKIDGYVVLFKPLQNTDFSEGEGTAAAEGEADAGAGEGAGGWGGGVDGGESGGAAGGGLALSALIALLAAGLAGGSGRGGFAGAFGVGHGHGGFWGGLGDEAGGEREGEQQREGSASGHSARVPRNGAVCRLTPLPLKYPKYSKQVS